MPQSRQLAAIMFTDIVGYTALMGADEKKAFQLLKKNREIQKPLIKQYNGTWIKELGDGVLASFHTVTDAVFCAAAIHQACNNVEGLQIRIGVHLGEVIFENNDVFGDGVNIASRLQAMASPGSTWVSEAVYKNLVNKKEITSEFIKEEMLKNVAEPVKVYEITVKEIPGYLPDNIKAYQQQSQAKKPEKRKLVFITSILLIAVLVSAYFIFFNKQSKPVTDKESTTEKSIAVIPFKLIGTDEEGRYFADGVSDVLINHLHEIKGLKVRSRTSVEQYRDTKKIMAEIAKELNVDYIIEGSAQKYKDDIRIIVQLINPETDEHIWKNEYNKKFEDILNVQSEIALQIVKELNIALAPEQKQRIEKVYTKKAEAWDHYLRGISYMGNWWKFREINDVQFAISFFKQAINRDTTFALAYTWLANAIRQKDWIDLKDKKTTKDSILLLIEKSIRLDPELADNYTLLGDLTYFQLNDSKKALEYLEKAISMDPEDPWPLFVTGIIFTQESKNLEALSYFGKAIKKEPDEIYSWLLFWTGFTYISIGEFELADPFYKKALELEPDNVNIINLLALHVQIQGKYDELLDITNKSMSIRKDNKGLNNLGKAYLLLEDYEKAENAYKQFFSLPRDIYYSESMEKSSYAQVLRKLGKEKEALKQVNEAKDWVEKEMRDPNYDLAKIYSFLGEKQKALNYLSKWRPNWGGHVWVEKDPLFENIRNEPEFKQLVLRFKSEIEVLRKEAQKKIDNGEFPTPEMIRQ